MKGQNMTTQAITKAQSRSLAITDNLATQSPAVMYLANLSTDAGRRVQRQALAAITGIFGAGDPFTFQWSALRAEHVAEIRKRLAEAYAPATANRILTALRGVLKAAFVKKQMTAEDYQRAVMIAPVRGSTIPAGRGLSSGDMSALMADCESDLTPAGARDAAIIGLMYSCGLRRAEVISADLADLKDGKLTVKGKGRKQRTAYITNGAARAMTDWLIVRGSKPGPLFLAINKAGKIAAARLTTQSIYKMLVSKRGPAAGLAEFSPHDLRRSFAGDMLDAGADIATVAAMMGHASVNTTARYDRRPEAAKQKAAGLLHVPYKGRHTKTLS
jgi:site-specific recombinase XerD